MKLVYIDAQTGTVSWDRYFTYLHENKHRFPDNLFAYAANWDHYSLESRATLHDAWLERIEFLTAPEESSIEKIKLEFLSPFHDQRFVFLYSGVKTFTVELKNLERPGHRDLLAHEFRIADGYFVHELLFAGCDQLEVKFAAVEISEQVFA